MNRFLPLLLVMAAAVNAGGQVRFIEDDYARALQKARAMNVPLFVETWAPW